MYRRLRDGAVSHAALAANSGCKSALRDAQPVGKKDKALRSPVPAPARFTQAQGGISREKEQRNQTAPSAITVSWFQHEGRLARCLQQVHCSQHCALPSQPESLGFPCNASCSPVTCPVQHRLPRKGPANPQGLQQGPGRF